MANRTCSIESCEDSRIVARGWCSRHYTRFTRYGDANFRIKGEIRDGRKICPSCVADVPMADYTQGSAYCRKCVADRKRARPLPEKVPYPMVHCIQCAAEFEPRAGNVYCCSYACTRSRAAAMDRRKLALSGRDAANAASRKWAAANKEKTFANSHRYRARKISAFLEDVDRQVVLDRDGWICQICGLPIDPGAKSLDPMSKSIDHRVPLVHGGLHSYENCQASHLFCNLSKGARIE